MDIASLRPLVLGHAQGSYASKAFLARIARDGDGSYRPMNRDVARENLELFAQALNENGLDFFIFFGTLLGAVREGGFIEHDYDTDTVIMPKDRAGLLDVVPVLGKAGFEFARCKNGLGAIFTFMRREEFIDVYVAEEFRGFPWNIRWNVDGTPISHDLLTTFARIEFLGMSLRAPRDSERAIVEMYGRDWKQAKKNCSARMAFDFRHPWISSVRSLRGVVPPRALTWARGVVRRG